MGPDRYPVPTDRPVGSGPVSRRRRTENRSETPGVPWPLSRPPEGPLGPETDSCYSSSSGPRRGRGGQGYRDVGT